MHFAGEKMFIDFSGDGITIVDSKTGECVVAKLFLAVLVRRRLGAFCTKCLSAIGRFYCEGAVEAVEGIWRASPNELARRALTDIVDVEIAKIRAEVRADHPFVEDVISAFKTDLSPAPRNPGQTAVS